jgi:hypothetical protein
MVTAGVLPPTCIVTAICRKSLQGPQIFFGFEVGFLSSAGRYERLKGRLAGWRAYL